MSSYFLFSRPVSIAARLLTFPKCVLAVLFAIGWQILYTRQRGNTRCMTSIEKGLNARRADNVGGQSVTGCSMQGINSRTDERR
ncbi:hypothetical protein M405DRAFT_83445 [Rhizopogon salebrosus TDB-379]|nr:hypothetical protein M405DRAFT_83445 [Rhizopogon salebrosus TDB-379]